MVNVATRAGSAECGFQHGTPGTCGAQGLSSCLCCPGSRSNQAPWPGMGLGPHTLAAVSPDWSDFPTGITCVLWP